MTFSESVTVSGAPRVGITVGERLRWAEYSVSTSGGTTLVFAYAVQADDRDDDGISIAANTLELNGGSIVYADGNLADLTHPAASASSNHKVNGSAQTVSLPPTRNAKPTFTAGATASRSVDENTAERQNIGAVIAATDADNGDTLSYGLRGDDSAFFRVVSVAGGAQLQTKDPLDYETKRSYSFVVTVSDNKNASGNTDSVSDNSIRVTITVNNLDEDGTVTFVPPLPEVGTAMTAPSLADNDGSVSGVTWAWERLDAADSTTGTALSATSSRYTPVAADQGKWLKATASYTDGHGPSKSASGLVPVPPAGAVWAAFLLVDGQGRWSGHPGCDDLVRDQDNCSSVLVNNQFVYGGVRYTITTLNEATSADAIGIRLEALRLESPGGRLDMGEIKAALSQLVLNGGAPRYSVADAVVASSYLGWPGKPGWTDGQMVVLWLAPPRPGQPHAPGVKPLAADKLLASWQAPRGPAAVDYDMRYREQGATRWISGPQGLVPDQGVDDEGQTRVENPHADIDGLSAGTTYEVQVRTGNDGGDGAWSESGVGTTPTTGAVAASVTSVSIDSTDAPFGLGEHIDVDVVFSDRVTVHRYQNPNIVPHLVIDVGGKARKADYQAGSRTYTHPCAADQTRLGCTKITFRYTVARDDLDTDGISIAENSLHHDGPGSSARRSRPI